MSWAVILSTVADSATLEKAEAALAASFSTHDTVPPQICMQMSIAVGELVANVVEHGTQGRLNVAIEVRMSIERDRVLVAIIDDGNETPTDLITVATMPDDLAERGRGLPMTQSVLESLTYERLPVANLWLLTSKRFTAAGVAVDLY